MSDKNNTPSPSTIPSTTTACTVSTTATSSRPTSSSKPPLPTSLSEWQLMGVLQKANLLQYYETFIAQGGDDINQIMQCDEAEFLEIMSLVGMLSKPLHVRRLQRTLTEFSKDPAAFNLASMQVIGPPPMPAFPQGANPIDFLIPGIAVSLGSALQSPSPSLFSAEPSTASFSASSTSSTLTTSNTTTTTPCSLVPTAAATISAIDFTNPLSSIGATANVLPGDYLQTLMASAASFVASSTANLRDGHTINTANSKEPGKARVPSMLLSDDSKTRSKSPHISSSDDFVALGDYDPNAPQTESPILSDAQIRRIQQCAIQVVKCLPNLAPKLVQNKKRISQEILDVMSLPITSAIRADEYRKYSAIYGRFDAKRKPDKVLTLHEVSVNEAAAQLCMLQPVLLTRRDELFPLARQVVRDAGYHYTKNRERKRLAEEGASPRSTPSVSPPPSLMDELDDNCGLGSDEKRRRVEAEKGSFLEKWAAGKHGASNNI